MKNNYRVDPEENARRLNLWRQGYTDAQIGKILGHDTSVITSWRMARGLPPNKTPANPRIYRYGTDDWNFQVGEKVAVIIGDEDSKRGKKVYGVVCGVYRRFIVIQLPKYRITVTQWELKHGTVKIERQKVG